MLSMKQISALKANKKRYSVKADDNLYVEVLPTGSKSWLFQKMCNGKLHKKVLGKVNALNPFAARRMRDDLLQKLEQAQTLTAGQITGPTFAEVAEEWMRTKCEPYTEKKNVDRQQSRLDHYILPALGNCECRSITAPQVLAVLRQIEAKGHNELAHRVAGLVSMILRFGVACGYTDRDVVPNLRGALVPVRVTHFASIRNPDEIGELMRKIEALPPCSTKYGLLLCAHTFCRPSEVRKAKWEEFDFTRAEWHIPAERMKMNRPHIVPLSTQVLEILAEAKRDCGNSDYVLPSPYGAEKCIGPDAFRTAFRRLGYVAGAVTAHGFRSTASTTLHERGWPSAAVELQLSHVDSDKVRAAYNHAELMDTRKAMTQWYSDFLTAVTNRLPIPKVVL